jgi:hypothetical protein
MSERGNDPLIEHLQIRVQRRDVLTDEEFGLETRRWVH